MDTRSPRDLALLALEIKLLSPTAQLRLAADLLDESARAGGQLALTKIAHSIVERVGLELGAAIALSKPPI